MVAHCRGILWIGGNKFLEDNPVEVWGFLDYLTFSSSLLTRLAVEFVIVFFVLSGFSIAHSLSKSSSKKQFYLKRLIRIYPPYLVALIWAGLVYLFAFTLQPSFFSESFDTLTFDRYSQMSSYFDPVQILKNLFYIPMDGFIVQFWSLSHEIIFYALAPFLFLNKRFYAFGSMLLFALYMLLFEIGSYEQPTGIIIKFLGIYNFYFFLGYTVYQHLDSLEKYLNRLTRRGWMIVLMVSLGSIYVVNFAFKSETVWSYMPAALFGILLIIYFLKYQLRINWLILIGRHSYTLYITHVASIFLYHTLYYTFFQKAQPPYIESYFVFMPAILWCVGLSYLQFYFVENKTRKLLNRIRSKKSS